MDDRVVVMSIDAARRVQSLYVQVSDGVRLAIDVWLPVERIARGERVGTAFRATRYYRAEQPPSPAPEAGSNYATGELWTRAGFALVVADARQQLHMPDLAVLGGTTVDDVRAVLRGLEEYKPRTSPRAILRAHPPTENADG